MIDALEIKVPAAFSPHSDMWSSLRLEEKSRKKGPYDFEIDCRKTLGFVLLYGHRHPIEPGARHYRVIFDAARQLTAFDIYLKLQSLFQVTPEDVRRLKVVRIDFAANVGQPVDWFREHFRVAGKRECREYVCVQTGQSQTLIFGKRPDRYSIYNKVQEVLDKGRDLLQRKPCSVTRVERQCTGAGVPSKMQTLGKVFKNASAFDPFNAVVLMESGAPPRSDEWTAQKWLMCLGVRAAIAEHGWVGARKEANRRSTRNNILERYLDLVQPKMPGLTRAELTAAYQKTATYQLNVPIDGVYPQGGVSYLL